MWFKKCVKSTDGDSFQFSLYMLESTEVKFGNVRSTSSSDLILQSFISNMYISAFFLLCLGLCLTLVCLCIVIYVTCCCSIFFWLLIIWVVKPFSLSHPTFPSWQMFLFKRVGLPWPVHNGVISHFLFSGDLTTICWSCCTIGLDQGLHSYNCSLWYSFNSCNKC